MTRTITFAFFFTFYLFGCGSAPKPVVVTKEVLTPVPVGCITAEAEQWLFGTPEWADTPEAIAQAENIAARVQLMISGRLQRDNWIEDAMEQLKICLRAPHQSRVEVTPAPATLP